MSEVFVKGANALTVASVEARSPADRAGLRAGDLLRAINGRPIIDILDYRFHAAESRLRMELERSGASLAVTLRKQPEQDAGISFESDLGDRVHTCKNKCVFCFIHQMPKKMRRSLYLMDDDFRLSFIHGNYVTLTNLSEAEWARILEQRLSPLYVSVHATDPCLRGRLLGRRDEAPILPQLRILAEAKIDVHAQVVLCPGWNDGEALDRTIEELAAEHPSQTGRRCGVLSVAIVPVGLTRFRERLPQIPHVELEYAREMIARFVRIGRALRRRLGTRFAWLADEWYYLAERPYPARAHYEEFPQLEDGIGSMRLFLDDAQKLERGLPARAETPVSATLVTAQMPSQHIRGLAARLSGIQGVDVNVCAVENRFFGGDIHIAGLMTATDIIEQVGAYAECRDAIILPRVCLRDDGLFLDDLTLDDVRRETGRSVVAVGVRPTDLAAALGLLRSHRSAPERDHRWLME